MAFWLYCTENFGRLHQRNPLIIEVATQIGRTPSALAMKACNFASLDPRMLETGRVGLSGASAADRNLWAEFEANPTQLGAEACARWDTLRTPLESSEQEPTTRNNSLDRFPTAPRGPTEVVREVVVRRAQRFFRNTLLATYEEKCAVTGLAVPELLVASHILPWASEEHRRADPRNGLLLNALLDRAFDRHLIAFDDDFRLICSPELHRTAQSAAQLIQLEGIRLRIPDRFAPDPVALARHRALLAA